MGDARFHYREEVAPATSWVGRLGDLAMGSCRAEEFAAEGGRVMVNALRPSADSRFIFERCARCRRVTVSYWALDEELPLTIPPAPFDD